MIILTQLSHQFPKKEKNRDEIENKENENIEFNIVEDKKEFLIKKENKWYKFIVDIFLKLKEKIKMLKKI